MSNPRQDRARSATEHNTNNGDEGRSVPFDVTPSSKRGGGRVVDDGGADACAVHFSPPSSRSQRIRALNDRLRRAGLGGMVAGSAGFVALDAVTQLAVLGAVRTFDAFTPANDPWGEHDCAVMEVMGLRIIWKIDAYERSLTLASPDPADPKVTRRVLTIMLADEY